MRYRTLFNRGKYLVPQLMSRFVRHVRSGMFADAKQNYSGVYTILYKKKARHMGARESHAHITRVYLFSCPEAFIMTYIRHQPAWALPLASFVREYMIMLTGLFYMSFFTNAVS